MLISIMLHLLLLWLLRWLPPTPAPELAAPVPIRLLQEPPLPTQPVHPLSNERPQRPRSPHRHRRNVVASWQICPSQPWKNGLTTPVSCRVTIAVPRISGRESRVPVNPQVKIRRRDHRN